MLAKLRGHIHQMNLIKMDPISTGPIRKALRRCESLEDKEIRVLIKHFIANSL
jgi:hypothetical protein